MMDGRESNMEPKFPPHRSTLGISAHFPPVYGGAGLVTQISNLYDKGAREQSGLSPTKGILG